MREDAKDDVMLASSSSSGDCDVAIASSMSADPGPCIMSLRPLCWWGVAELCWWGVAESGDRQAEDAKEPLDTALMLLLLLLLVTVTEKGLNAAC
jgi:hypothetical protein